MKKILFLMAFLAWSPASAESMSQQPIMQVSSPTAVSVSTSQYTNATPSGVRTMTTTLNLILIDNPSTNTATVHGHIWNCTSTSFSTSTIKGPIEIAPASNGGYIALPSDMCLWLVSRHTAAETVYVQGASQNKH